MPFRLRDRIHWCDCLGRAIFLDAAQDRYFCLSATTNAAFLRLAAGNSEPGDSAALRSLVERNILIEEQFGAAGLPSAAIDEPAGDFPTHPDGRASLPEILRALAAEVRAAWLLRRPIGQAIDAAARAHHRRRSSTNVERTIASIVMGSGAAAYLTRTHDRCLVRAFAVHAACKRKGIAAKLVFGVVANPFAAHCWVQLGPAVLVGGFEQARLYTPVLVVE